MTFLNETLSMYTYFMYDTNTLCIQDKTNIFGNLLLCNKITSFYYNHQLISKHNIRKSNPC